MFSPIIPVKGSISQVYPNGIPGFSPALYRGIEAPPSGLFQRSSICVPTECGDAYLGCVSRFGSEIPLSSSKKPFGDLSYVRDLAVLYPGFLLGNVVYEEAMRGFDPAPDQLLVSLSIYGPGAALPAKMPLTPEVLTGLYTEAVRFLAKQSTQLKKVVFAGSSMGGLLALASALIFDEQANSAEQEPSSRKRPPQMRVIIDNGMPFDARETAKNGLFRLMAIPQRISRALFSLAFQAIRIPFVRNILIRDYFQPEGEEEVNPEKLKLLEARLDWGYRYIQALFRQSSVGRFAELLFEVPHWKDFFLQRFKKYLIEEKGEICAIRPPCPVTVIGTKGDRIFGVEVAQKLAALTQPSFRSTQLTPAAPLAVTGSLSLSSTARKQIQFAVSSHRDQETEVLLQDGPHVDDGTRMLRAIVS